MGDKFEMTVGQAHEFALACARNGLTAADVKKMCASDFLAQILLLIRGQARVVAEEHLIDCDAAPYIPSGWSIKPEDQLPNAVGGKVIWGAARVALYLSERQQNGHVITGTDLRAELASQPVLKANVLDYLLAHPEIIPDDWKKKVVFFWGTIYRDSGGGLCVRALYWDGGRWHWHCDWLAYDWHGGAPAALLASM